MNHLELATRYTKPLDNGTHPIRYFYPKNPTAIIEEEKFFKPLEVLQKTTGIQTQIRTKVLEIIKKVTYKENRWDQGILKKILTDLYILKKEVTLGKSLKEQTHALDLDNNIKAIIDNLLKEFGYIGFVDYAKPLKSIIHHPHFSTGKNFYLTDPHSPEIQFSTLESELENAKKINDFIQKVAERIERAEDYNKLRQIGKTAEIEDKDPLKIKFQVNEEEVTKILEEIGDNYVIATSGNLELCLFLQFKTKDKQQEENFYEHPALLIRKKTY